jgi:hypothetical protein
MAQPAKFIYHMMAERHRRYPRTPLIEALGWSVHTLKEFMAMDQIKFGDKNYDWSRAGAIDLVDAFDYV